MKNYTSSLTKMAVFVFIALFLTVSGYVSAQGPTDGLKLLYTFDSATDSIITDASGNGYNGRLYNGASIGTSADGRKVLILGADGNDYLDMGAATGGLVATLNDFTISTYVYVDPSTNLGANGNFVAVFSNSADQGNDANGFLYLQAKRSRYAISSSGWQNEMFVSNLDADITKGQWVHMVYTQTGDVGKMYINGVEKRSSDTISLKPSTLGITPYNFIGKPCFSTDAYLMNAQISDFRIYNRALSQTEILNTAYPEELNIQWDGLDLGDLSAVISNLTLPTTLGTNGVTVTWSSGNTNAIANDGTVTRPDKYDATVILTATLSFTHNGITYTRPKTFSATVIAYNVASELIAKWNFADTCFSVQGGEIKVKDVSENAFIGSVKNVATIRTIGITNKINVLDLGNNNGYFDMGTGIGEAIYSLSDYTIGAYFYIDESNTTLNNNGNFLWNISNSVNIATDQNGIMFGSLKIMGQRISAKHWTGEQGIQLNTNAPKGSWHHMAYSQSGTTGTLFVDGEVVATGTVTHLPSTALVIPGRTGTLYNFLGRPSYSTDTYLRNTLVYGFELYRFPLTADDLKDDDICDVDGNLVKLTAAYNENPRYTYPELDTEANNLTLGDLSAVTDNLTLPVKGSIDQAIQISWKSNSGTISNTGVVTRPDYFNATVTLTAVLMKNGNVTTKTFNATVVAKPATGFASNLLVKYDFQNVNGTTVTDAAEKQLTGTIVGDANIQKIGVGAEETQVLSLGNTTGYFDMGTEVGKLVYGLRDYTIGAYYRINNAYTAINTNGNFLWTLSNTDNVDVNPNGYIIGSLKSQALSITPINWQGANGNEAVAYNVNAAKDGWHHFAYTQSGTTGTIYVDGVAVATGPVNNLPAVMLPKEGRFGTLYNWIGRSCYVGDVYLRQTLVYDFRLYNTALTADEIASTVLDVPNTIVSLDKKYNDYNGPVKTKEIKNNGLVYSNKIPGQLEIFGLNGKVVSVYTLTGRVVTITKSNVIALKPGVYIVKTNNAIKKVVVR